MSEGITRKKDSLVDVVDKVLDKGVVVNADVVVEVDGRELLTLRLRATIASFQTAAEYGLEFPSGLDDERFDRAVKEGLEPCPECGKKVQRGELLEDGCPWCGWVSAKAKEANE